MIAVALATEDELSEAVGLRLLSESPALLNTNPLLLRKQGFGYLKSRMHNWKQMANHSVVLILTDLDRADCPIVLLNDWLGKGEMPPENLLLRIAVREIESWILADHEAFSSIVGNKGRLPVAPDELPDPKQYLLNLAKNASRAIRDDLVAQEGTVASQGLGYNNRLVGLVNTQWSPERAAARSPSLQRARDAINRLSLKLLEKNK